MNNNMNEQNNQKINDIYPINNIETVLNNNQSIVNNNLSVNENLNYTDNVQNSNYVPNNNGKNNNKTKKIIIISAIVLLIIIIILILISLLLKSPDNDLNNKQNQTNTNKEENSVQNEEQLNNTDEDIIENEEQISNDDEKLPNTDIIKRSLGQVSTFDSGISIKVTDSIQYAENEGIYYKPMFIKVELSNNSNRIFYQDSIQYGAYSIYTENPIEFIRDDFDYTSFSMIPMYLLGDEVKTESAGCVLRKTASAHIGNSDGKGGFSDINYLILKPGEQATAYLMCYFREEIDGAKIKTIYLQTDSNQFMYFID